MSWAAVGAILGTSARPPSSATPRSPNPLETSSHGGSSLSLLGRLDTCPRRNASPTPTRRKTRCEARRDHKHQPHRPLNRRPDRERRYHVETAVQHEQSANVLVEVELLESWIDAATSDDAGDENARVVAETVAFDTFSDRIETASRDPHDARPFGARERGDSTAVPVTPFSTEEDRPTRAQEQRRLRQSLRHTPARRALFRSWVTGRPNVPSRHFVQPDIPSSGPSPAEMHRTPGSHHPRSGSVGARVRLTSEVDGNRTRRTGSARPNRFEGGGAHQVPGHLRVGR